MRRQVDELAPAEPFRECFHHSGPLNQPGSPTPTIGYGRELACDICGNCLDGQRHFLGSQGLEWWAMRDSNSRHLRCKRSALPTELIARSRRTFKRSALA